MHQGPNLPCTQGEPTHMHQGPTHCTQEVPTHAKREQDYKHNMVWYNTPGTKQNDIVTKYNGGGPAAPWSGRSVVLDVEEMTYRVYLTLIYT